MNKQSEIRRIDLFAGCRPEQARWIERNCDVIDVQAGQVIALEGEGARQFVLVVSGVVTSESAEGWEILGPGSHFGEVSLIAGRPNESTVISETAVRLLVFEARAFRGLLERVPSVARKLLREFVEDAYISAGQTA